MQINVINYLVCPICHADFSFSIHKKIKERIIEGELKYEKCGRKFYIKNEIVCFDSYRKKQFESDAQKLRKTTIEQEIPKKWIRLFSKPELAALKKEWSFLLSVVKKNKSAIHLDFATGTGRFLRNIIPKTKGEIIAIDNGYGTCQELRYFLKKTRKYDRISIICADVQKMPFRNETFNSASSWHGLNEPKMKDAIKETKRVLKNKSYFAASGIHYQEGSKSFLRAKKHNINFLTKEKIMLTLKNIGFHKIEHEVFYKGRWNEEGDYLPIFGDLYITYAVRGEK
jgi:SAM-dependent methyltransferase